MKQIVNELVSDQVRHSIILYIRVRLFSAFCVERHCEKCGIQVISEAVV